MLDGDSCCWLNVEPGLVVIRVGFADAVKLLAQKIRALEEVWRGQDHRSPHAPMSKRGILFCWASLVLARFG